MGGFIQGIDRQQATLFPERLDEYIAEENSVRVIDVFVDSLKLINLGFTTIPSHTGRPGYHPSMLLKLYIYGYLNQVQSTRRLEREAQRNVELMWLLGRLAPDFKTIADFRKDNGKAIKSVCREFVSLCKDLDLFADTMIAIDGSKFKAVNSPDRAFSKTKIKKRREKIEESIDKYLDEIKRADRLNERDAEATKTKFKERLGKVKEEAQRLEFLEEQVLEAPDQQIAMTDPDSRIMATRGRSSVVVGYNVQSAVDTKNHLIADHFVTNVGHDRSQLATMAIRAQEVLDCDNLEVLADRGYYSGDEILACENAGITSYLPKNYTSGNRAKGLYDKSDFIYDKETDTYRCPADQVLIKRGRSLEKGRAIDTYYASYTVCEKCPQKTQCTTGRERRVRRWESEDTLDNLETRMIHNPDKMNTRRSTVEHPFGTIKSWMGHTHFQMRTLEKVGTEMSLHVLSYNLKRVMSILGIKNLISAINNKASA